MQLKDLRTALFGFNKNDVCTYISELNLIYEQKEQQQQQEQAEMLKELNSKNEELSNNASRLNQETTELKRERDELLGRIDSFDRETEELKQQIAKMRELIASILGDVKERLNLAEQQISELQPGQNDENNR